MSTPRGAEHRDLEQRLRAMERQLRELAGAALRRPQASVTSGDFTVAGGGGVVIRDGGKLVAQYPSGRVATRFGPTDAGSYDLTLLAQDGNVVLGGAVYPDGYASVAVDASHLFMAGDEAATLIGGDHSTENYSTLNLYPNGADLGTKGQLTLRASGGGVVYISEGGLDVQHAAVMRSTTDMQGNAFVRGQFVVPNIGGTSGGANVFLNNNNQLRKVTSSRRYKADERPLELDTRKALQLEPKSFTRRDEADQDTPPVYAGVMAEDADELGLHHFVEYDDQGRPESFAYATWTVALQAIVRDQQTQLDDQAETIRALTERLEALEAAA